MYFYHADAVWDQFPKLTALILVLRKVRSTELKADTLDEIFARIAVILEKPPEGELPSIGDGVRLIRR